MKKLLFLLLFMSAICSAQEKEKSNEFGIGISLLKESIESNATNYAWYMLSSIYYPIPELKSLTIPTVYFPLTINDYFRLEPEFGFVHCKDGSYDRDNIISVKQWGINIFGMYPMEKINILYGAGIRYQYIQQEYHYHDDVYNNGEETIIPSNTKNKQKNLQYGPVIGFEAILHKHFRIAGQVQATFEEKGKWSDDYYDRADKAFKIQPMIILYWTI